MLLRCRAFSGKTAVGTCERVLLSWKPALGHQKQTEKGLVIENLCITAPIKKDVSEVSTMASNTQAHRNLRGIESSRCHGWSTQRMGQVLHTTPQTRFKRSISTVLGFWRFGNEITKQDQKQNRHPRSVPAPFFFEPTEILFRHILITQGEFVPVWSSYSC